MSRQLFTQCANGGTRWCIRGNSTEWALEEGEQRLSVVEQPKQRGGSNKAGSRHTINNPEMGRGNRNVPKRS